jgi:hypothetical protein
VRVHDGHAVQLLDDGDPGREGDAHFGVGAVCEDDMPGAEPNLGLELPNERRLADTGLTNDRNHAWLTATSVFEMRHKATDLVFAIDELVESQLRTVAGVSVFVGDGDSVATIPFGLERRTFSSRDKRVRAFAMRGCTRDADGDSDRKRVFTRVTAHATKLRRRGAQAFRNFHGNVESSSREQHEELVAVQATDQISGSNTALQDFRDGPQNVVALQAAERVRDAPEVVDVDHQETDAFSRAAALA